MPLDPALLTTPTGHGGVLVVPEPGMWGPCLRHNEHALRGTSVRVGDKTLAAWRSATRLALTGSDDRPIVVLGHQPEFIHPGVWAKHIVASRLARAVNGIAVNLIVDNDVLKSSTIALPHHDAHQWTLKPIRFTPAGATTPYEFLPALPPFEIARIESEFRATIGHHFAASLLPVYLEELHSIADPQDWVQQTVAGRRAVDQSFGIDLLEHRVSQVSFTPLLLETLREPLRFARAYNTALHEYRRAHAVRDPRRPMPDLLIAHDRIELPWWAVQPRLPRQRLFLQTIRNHKSLLAEQSPLLDLEIDDVSSTAALNTILAGQSTWSIRPRAITLTLWARLLLADFFLHGIGGAKYDAVCDAIMEHYFGLSPPHFAAVSATLHWNTSTESQKFESPRDAARALRDLRYNPQRHSPHTAEIAELVKQRQNAIDQSNALARQAPHDHVARRRAFEDIQNANHSLQNMIQPLRRDIELRMADAARRTRQLAMAQGREYFFAAYPRTELTRLAAALPDSASFGL